MGNLFCAKSTKCNLKKLLLFIVITLSFNNVIAQSIQWQKSLGGTGQDEANSIQQTADGGFVIAGVTYSNDGDVTDNHGSSDIWVVKLDNMGNIQWQKSLGGGGDDWGTSIQQTCDGGYIVGGYSNSNDGDVIADVEYNGIDYWIVKLDMNGTLQWQKKFGGTGYDAVTSIRQTSDSSYIIAGVSFSNDADIIDNHGSGDFWIIRLNYNGSLQWKKSFGGTQVDNATSIIQTADDGFVISGYSNSKDGDVTGNHGEYDYWIIKLDNLGSLQWQKSIGGSGNDFAYFIQETKDRCFIVAGGSFSNDGDVSWNQGYGDFWIVKLDTIGNILWQKSVGGSYIEVAKSIHQTLDGGYIVAGECNSNDGDITGFHGWSDGWVVKLDELGNLQWQKSLGGTKSDWIFSIKQTVDGDYILSGATNSTDGDVTNFHGGWDDCWIIRLDDKQTGTANIISQQNISIYPNPVSSKLTVDLSGSGFSSNETIISLLNMNGEKVLEKTTENFINILNVEGITKGMYFIKIESKAKYLIEKLVVK
jgi:hypothetical protein